MRILRRMPRRTKGIFWAALTFFAFMFLSAPYWDYKGWSMVELIVNAANRVHPAMSWDYGTGYRIEAFILGNLFIVFAIGFVAALVLFFISYFSDKDEESAELKAIKALPREIVAELAKTKKTSKKEKR